MVRTKEGFMKKYSKLVADRYSYDELMIDLISVIKTYTDNEPALILNHTQEPTDEEHKKFIKIWQEAIRSNQTVGTFNSF